MLIDLSLQKIVSKFKQRVHTLLMLFAIIYVGFAAVDVLASDDIKNIEKKIDEQRAILDELENQLDRVAGERENKIDKPALPNASSAALILNKHPDAAIGRGEDFIGRNRSTQRAAGQGREFLRERTPHRQGRPDTGKRTLGRRG